MINESNYELKAQFGLIFSIDQNFDPARTKLHHLADAEKILNLLH